MSVAAVSKLALVLLAAGEPSKVPFYVAGGLLAGWAVLVSVLGLRQPDFPKTQGAARAVMAVSAILVLTAASMAVATSKRPVKTASAATPTGASGTSGASGAGAPPHGARRGGPSSPASTLSIAADPSGQLRYDQMALHASAGRVTFAFTNHSSTPHNFTLVQGTKSVAATATITASQAKLTSTLAPGTYTYFCSVDSHRQAGMQGTLVVR